jgi:hypothetical protein
MDPIAHSDGSDAGRAICEAVSSFVAMLNLSLWSVKMRFDSQLSRTICQIFSTGLSSGLLSEELSLS